MDGKNNEHVERVIAYDHFLRKRMGKAVRPYRQDGFVNVLNRYGTNKDTSERYQFMPEAAVPDEVFIVNYEGNGLFAKIIDTPAEEAVKHGFELDGVSDEKVEEFYQESLDELDWEEVATTGIRWARLFGGAIAVLLVNDGHGLEDPLDWKNIKSIDDIRVYDRSVITPDYSSMYTFDSNNEPFTTRGSRLGMPEYYHVNSRFGNFTVHESRCLIFQNGILPENTKNSIYQLWGMPEYIRIRRALRDAEIAHSSAPKMLDRSVQPVYKMKDLAEQLATEQGESLVLKRLEVIDMARGLLNTIAVDRDGEEYDFRTFQYSGVSDVIDATCNLLSAITNIPQTILFGRSPAGMNATGESDLENYYNYIERIQKRMLKSNLRYLLSIIFQAGLATGEVDEVPRIKIKFNPLWSLSELEQAELESKKAATDLTIAQTAQVYIDMQALDATEVRKKLADSSEFDINTILDEDDIDGDFMDAIEDEEIDEPKSGNSEHYSEGVSLEEHNTNTGAEGSAPANAPAATKLPQDMSGEELAKAERNTDSLEDDSTYGSVGVIVINDGLVLSATRHNDFGYGLVCGPGGHIEDGETPEEAAFRETEEEFGIRPTELIPLGRGPLEHDTGLRPHLFLCTQYEGEPNCADLEMTGAKFRTVEELDELAASMFQPFADGLGILKMCIDTALFYSDDGNEMYDNLIESIGEAMNMDGGPGSGNWGHSGRPGKKGGSAGGTGGVQHRTGTKESGFSSAAKERAAKKKEIAASKREVGGSNKSTPEKKYEILNDRVSKIKNSQMSKEEKANAYIKTLEDCEVGTTFKLQGMEYRKGTDKDYPYEIIDFEGKYVNAFSSRTVSLDIKWHADKQNCLEFFDKNEQIAERKKLVKEMKESGRFKTSDSVHAEKDGKITLNSKNFGEAGEYVVYRNGNVGSSGMVFLSPKKEVADSYAFSHNGENTKEYEVRLEKPLVIDGPTDVACITKAYNTLHPEKPHKGELTSSKWISYDKANASALNKNASGYDSIIYIINGKPAEVQVSAKKAKIDLKKTAEYTVADWSENGLTYEEQVMRGYIGKEAEDYKRVDSRKDGKTNPLNPEKSIDFFNTKGTIKENGNFDGGSGSGNHGHEGVKGQRGGSKTKNSPPEITKFKTSNGSMKITSDLSVKFSKSGKSTVTIKAGEEITGIYSFAGKGSGKNLVVSGLLAKQYGGEPKEWAHLCGFADVITDKGNKYCAEIHWFEHEDVGQIKFKVKAR